MILVVCFQNLLIMKTVPMIARRAVLTVKQVVSHVDFFFLFQSLAIPFFRLFLYEKLKVPFIPVQFLRHTELFYFVKEIFPIFLLLFYIVHTHLKKLSGFWELSSFFSSFLGSCAITYEDKYKSPLSNMVEKPESPIMHVLVELVLKKRF